MKWFYCFIYSFAILFSFCNNSGVKRYNFSTYLGVNFLDFIEHYKSSFKFSRFTMIDDYFYSERCSIGSNCIIKISKNVEYYLGLLFGLGTCFGYDYAYSLLFLEFLPIGFIYNIDKFISVGFQIGYDLWINPKNKCRNAFYINFKDVCVYLNIFRYKNVISFTFSKKLKFYNILKCRLERVFINGWNVKLEFII